MAAVSFAVSQRLYPIPYEYGRWLALVACMVVLLSSQRLTTSGFVFYVLAFYLVALPIDTIMAVMKTAAGGT